MKVAQMASICCLLVFFCSFQSFANTVSANSAMISEQNADKLIQGTVLDSKGEPLVGASIMVKGTSIGTNADADGHFSLNAPEGAILLAQFMGYVDTEVKIGKQNTYNIVMSEDQEYLDEVVVVGYGTIKKANLTGSVSAVNFDENLTSRPVLNIANSLTGMSSGLSIRQTASTPGAENYSVLIRGMGTMNNASPLVIVDGVPGAINDVNPSDVESVSVLKDAASAAIYGSRAANGVILINTKRGKEGKFEVNYNGYVGRESAAKEIDFISDMATHVELVNEAEGREKYPQTLIDTWKQKSAAGDALYPNTDWYDEMLNPSTITEHNISVRGGTQRANIAMSVGYLDNKGIIDNSEFKKYSFRINADVNVTDWFSAGGNVYGFWSDRDPINVSTFFSNIRNTVPGIIPKSADGRYGGIMFEGMAKVSNPRAYVDNIRGNYERQKLGLKFFTKIKFLKYFQWDNSFGFDFDNRRNWEYTRPYSLWDFQTEVETSSSSPVDQLMNSSVRYYTYVYDSILRFNYSINKAHNISAMAGFDAQYNRMDSFNATMNDIIGDDQIYVLSAGTEMYSIKGTATDDALESIYGRVNYDYKGKYLLELDARYDGSSRFSSSKRWGFFPSFSAGWRITEEKFAAPLKSVFDDLKIRYSYGKLGNNSIGDYTWQPLYSSLFYPFGGSLQQAIAPTELVNRNIKWETTTVTNAGIDFSTFNNRLHVSADYYEKVTNDILAKKPIPRVLGFSSPSWQNIAKMKNNGLELEATWNGNIGKDFYYTVSGNLSTIHNKVLKFGEDEASGLYMIKEGKPYYCFYLLEYDHIIQDQSEIDQLKADGYTFAKEIGGDPSPGDLLYKDSNGDKIFNLEDRTVRNYSSLPKFTYGLNLSMAYKGIDLSIAGQGISGTRGYWGNDGFNTFNINEGFLLRKTTLKRWTESNKSTKYPKLHTSASTLNTVNSDYWLYNTSFFRIKSIQLGYTLPSRLTQRLCIKRVRIYTNMENYFTFTSFDGYNPESPSMSYPLMKQWVIGVNLTF